MVLSLPLYLICYLRNFCIATTHSAYAVFTSSLCVNFPREWVPTHDQVHHWIGVQQGNIPSSQMKKIVEHATCLLSVISENSTKQQCIRHMLSSSILISFMVFNKYLKVQNSRTRSLLAFTNIMQKAIFNRAQETANNLTMISELFILTNELKHKFIYQSHPLSAFQHEVLFKTLGQVFCMPV